MKLNNQSNVYWYSKIKSIMNGIDEKNNLKYSIIKAVGKASMVDDTNPTKKKILNQSVTIFAIGGLACYVESELDLNDEIFTMGKFITKKRKRGGAFFNEQCIEADAIFKADWLKFYSGRE